MTSARKITLALIALDALAVIASFNLVAWARGLVDLSHPIISPLFLPVLIHWLGVYLIDGYSSRTDMMSITYASLHVIAQAGVLLVTLLLTYAFIPGGFQLQSSRLVTAVSYLAVIPLSLGYRRMFYQRQLARMQRHFFLFLGSPQNYEAFTEECRKHGMNQGVLNATHQPVAATAGTSNPPTSGDVLQLLQEYEGRIDAIILRESSQELPPAIAQRLVELSFSGLPTYTLELFHQVYWRKIPLYRLNQTWLFQEGFQIAREPVFERLKRLSDILFSAVGLLLFAPFFPFIAAAIWLTDRGPVFFHQTRVGRNRVLFEAYKLRSMRVQHAGDPYTRPDDDRITPIGRFLRATRLDEVPQLWNVFRGDMSIIGPRAEWVRLVEQYERQIPCYHFRHLVKPGITGWAQVNYPYGANLEDTLRKLEYDLYYIRFFSFVLDASITLKTIHVMLFGKGR
ncbi:MAG: exopolysaccharide biosynthesis polyprenyl glycosylphosphotransferase [Candidatus Didemnitutus sp.]|nr:exopolysaccharide biosynthesis polyprenyl glycosylphosphotransferase [Candidatus Didemnitutus sp.]